MKEIYCDNSATTPIYPAVIKEMEQYFTKIWGNPSSIYARGRIAKEALINAKERVARILNCNPSEIYFTSGGSESDNLFIKGCFKENSTIITSPIEHPAIMNSCKAIHKLGAIQITLPVNKFGIIMTIGIYAANDSREYKEMKQEIGRIIKEYEHIKQIHGFFVDEKEKAVYFDLIIGFECKNREEIKDEIEKKLKEKYPEYNFYVIIDDDITD